MVGAPANHARVPRCSSTGLNHAIAFVEQSQTNDLSETALKQLAFLTEIMGLTAEALRGFSSPLVMYLPIGVRNMRGVPCGWRLVAVAGERSDLGGL